MKRREPRAERPLLRLILAVAPSLVLHAGLFTGLVVLAYRTHRTGSAAPPIELLDVHGVPKVASSPAPARRAAAKAAQPRQSAPAAVVPSRRVAASRPAKRPATQPARMEAASAPASAPTDGMVANGLAPDAPASARLVVLLRLDRIRGTPYRAETQRVLERLPDYWSLLGGAGEAAFATFDSLLIATANPLDVTATFLAARYHCSPAEVRATLDRGANGAWQWASYRGVAEGQRPPGIFDDPRVLLAPVSGLLVLTRPEFVNDLLDGLTATPATSLPASQPATWLGRLSTLEQATGGAAAAGPLALVTATDVAGLFGVVDTGELPIRASLGIRAASPPASGPADPAATSDLDVEALLSFRTPEDARGFVDSTWPLLRSLAESQPFIGYAARELEQFTAEAVESDVRLRGRVPGGQVALFLALAQAALPAPPNAPRWPTSAP